jgi:carboxylesterase
MPLNLITGENSGNSPRIDFAVRTTKPTNLGFHVMSGTTLPKPFDGSEHRSFLWKEGDPAALLVHGFPGTPAEMRPLGVELRQAGWTVHGLMLPGLGADIENLDKRTFQDWLEAVSQAVKDLAREHSVIVVIGYSMGGALALHAAVEQPPAGLVLLAPFWSLGEGWVKLLWPIVRLLFHRVKPLKHTDFSARDVRHGLQRMFQNIDLENPQIRLALRQLTVSSSPIEQVRQLGLSAFERAAKINLPTLVIQGRHDKIVPTARTLRLIHRFPNPVQCHNVNAAHDLVDPQSGAWTQVRDGLLSFVESVRNQAKKNLC